MLWMPRASLTHWKAKHSFKTAKKAPKNQFWSSILRYPPLFDNVIHEQPLISCENPCAIKTGPIYQNPGVPNPALDWSCLLVITKDMLRLKNAQFDMTQRVKKGGEGGVRYFPRFYSSKWLPKVILWMPRVSLTDWKAKHSFKTAKKAKINQFWSSILRYPPLFW